MSIDANKNWLAETWWIFDVLEFPIVQRIIYAFDKNVDGLSPMAIYFIVQKMLI